MAQYLDCVSSAGLFLLQVNRSRFDYQTEMLSASLLILYMPIFVDLLLICVVLFGVIDVS